MFFFAVLTKVYWYPKSSEGNGAELELIYIDTLTSQATNIGIENTALNLDGLTIFDPNKVDEEFFEKINLHSNLSRNWLKYLKSGGAFYKAEDLKRLYGFPDSIYNQLAPFVQLQNKSKFKKKPFKQPRNRNVEPTITSLNINTADSALFTKVKGIGPTYASRIVKYRQALGGFVDAQQLFEVYGVDSMMLVENAHFFNVDTHNVKQININTVEFKPLLKHPYFNYKQVKSIINFRKQHGDFLSKSDLLKIVVLDSIWFRKVEPYITVE
jgi:DNA uptake protein ComE-like DNA-binding protein